MEEKKEKKFKWHWIYIPYSPYIFLMTITYLTGVFIAMFQAFFMFFYDRDEYYPMFKKNEEFFKKIFLSMFDD